MINEKNSRDAWSLIKLIRDVSSWSHPARIGLGRIIARSHAMQTTDQDLADLRLMLEAVKA